MSMAPAHRAWVHTDDCGICKGAGYRVWRNDAGTVIETEVCRICGGTGEQSDELEYSVDLKPLSRREGNDE